MWLRLRHSGTAQEENTAGALTGATLGSWVESSSGMTELKTESLHFGFQNIQTLWSKNSTSGNIPSGKHIAMEKALCNKDVQHSLVYKSKTTVQMPNNRRLVKWSWVYTSNGEVMKVRFTKTFNNKKCLCYITNATFKRQDSELWIQNNHGSEKQTLVVQGLRLPASYAGGTGSTPDWGTILPHSQKKQTNNKLCRGKRLGENSSKHKVLLIWVSAAWVSLWKGMALYTYDICTFLYVCQTSTF